MCAFWRAGRARAGRWTVYDVTDDGFEWELEAEEFFPDSLAPPGHASDPFACPCCSNVFSEMLRLAEIDLASHAHALERSPERDPPSISRSRT